MAMPKFPDPTKKYSGEPVDETIDATKLGTEQYKQPPQPTGSETTPVATPNTPQPQSQPSTPPPSSTTSSPPLTPPPTKPGVDSSDSKSKTFTPPPKKSPFKNIVPLFLGILVFGGIIYAVIRFVLPMFLSNEPDPVTLTYWGLWEPQSVMQQVISDYERENPHVTINYTMQSPKNYRTRLLSAISEGQGPDIARVHNTWMPMFEGSLSPAPSEIVTSEDISDFYPVVQKNFSVGGKMYALPTMIDGLALFYNPKLLSSANATPPEDWNDLRKLAFRLTSRNAETGIIERAGAAIGTTGNISHWSDILGLLMLQNSADPTDPTSQPAQDALTFYTIFSTQDKIWDETQPNANYAFATESLAMMIAPSWQIEQVQAINPDLNFAIAEAPVLPDRDIAWATYWAEAVPVSSQNQEEAWKFISYLTSPETLQKLYTAQSQTRGHGTPYPRKSMASLLEDDPLIYPFVSQAPKYDSWYLTSETHDEGINDQIIKYFEDAVNLINDGRSVSSTTRTLSEGVTQILSKYGLAE